MPLEAIGLLVILLILLVFLVFELLAVDVLAIGLLGLIWLLGFVDVDEAVSGFGNRAVLTVAAMFVLSRAMVKTGVLEVLGGELSGLGGKRKWIGLGLFLISVSFFSAFINNVAAVAIFIPVAIKLAGNYNLSPSKILIPLSYAAIYGGTMTLIGTSTNLLVAEISENHAQPPLGMFEFFGLGVVFVVAGTLYNLMVLPRILPARAQSKSLAEKYRLSTYLTEFKVRDSSPLAHSTCAERKLNEIYDVTVLSIIRGADRYDTNLRNMPLLPNDTLLARGTVESFVKIRDRERLLLLSDIKLSEKHLKGRSSTLVEGLVSPESSLIGQTLKEINFRRRFGAFVLAIGRHDKSLRSTVGRIKLKLADTLLMLAPQASLPAISESPDLVILQQHETPFQKPRFWWLPIFIIPMIMILAALGIVDIFAGALVGIFLLLASQSLSTKEAYQAINWQVIVFVAAFIPFGTAMENSGLVRLAGTAVIQIGDWIPTSTAPYVLLSMTYLITSLLTEVISNNAAAIVLTPIAISMANTLGVDARPFIFAICYAASASFMTPIGYKTNLMVYSPGKYRVTDYLKAGALLNLTFWILASLLIPCFWPF